MPLITIEYTANITEFQAKHFSLSIHNILEIFCEAQIASCKSVIRSIDNYVIGTGVDDKDAFILIHIGMLPGRTQTQKTSAAEAIIEETNKLMLSFSNNADLNLQIRVRFFELIDYFFG